MADILRTALKSSIGWLELGNYAADPTDTNTLRRGICFVGTDLKLWDGSSWTGINADELDSVGDAAFGIPFVVSKTVAALAAAGTNIVTTHPKLKVLDAWFVATSADAGTIAVHSGQVGALGNAITDVITIGAGDTDITRASEIDDDEWVVAEDTGLVAVGDGGAAIDGTIFVLCMRVD